MEGVTITHFGTFQTVQELMEHYSKPTGGLCMTLTKIKNIDRTFVLLFKCLNVRELSTVWERMWSSSAPAAMKEIQLDVIK